MKKIMVTGAAGYIGGHLVRILRKKYEVHTVDIKPHNGTSLTVNLAQPFIDIKKYDTVVHLAAYCNVSKSTNDPAAYYYNNIMSTINCLTHYNYDNFVFASTGSAAGLQSPYAISKKACEDIITNWCEKENKKYTIFRFYNVTGSDGIAPTNPDGLFSSLMRAEKTGEFNVFGCDYNTRDGSAVRDYTHVLEICNAIVRAIEEPANGLENLGHGNRTTVKEMVELYKKANNVNFKIVEKSRRPGDLEVSVVPNVSRYMTKLFTLEEMLKRDPNMVEMI